MSGGILYGRNYGDPGPITATWVSATRVIQETAEAMQFDVEMAAGSTRPVWLPKSEIEIWEDGVRLHVRLPIWLWEERELHDAASITPDFRQGFREAFRYGKQLKDRGEDGLE